MEDENKYMEELKSNRDRQAELSKHHLFTSAYELFTEKSYREVKIKDICQKAGVSVGLFYHHFSNKETLYNETFVYYMNHDKRSYEADLSNPIESIRKIISTNISGFVEMGPEFTTKFLCNELLTNYEYLNDDNRNLNKNIIKCIDSAIEQGVLQGNRDDIANGIFRSIKGVGFNWAINDGKFNFVTECIRLVDTIIAYHRTS